MNRLAHIYRQFAYVAKDKPPGTGAWMHITRLMRLFHHYSIEPETVEVSPNGLWFFFHEGQCCANIECRDNGDIWSVLSDPFGQPRVSLLTCDEIAPVKTTFVHLHNEVAYDPMRQMFEFFMDGRLTERTLAENPELFFGINRIMLAVKELDAVIQGVDVSFDPDGAENDPPGCAVWVETGPTISTFEMRNEIRSKLNEVIRYTEPVRLTVIVSSES